MTPRVFHKRHYGKANFSIDIGAAALYGLPTMPTRPTLRDKLKPYGLHQTAKLAKALGIHRQQASRWLIGQRYSVDTAKKIGKAIGVSWDEVLRWQEDGR